MRSKRILVVSWQLEELFQALEGGSVLFRNLRGSQLANEDQVIAAERAALSILDLTVAHMRQLVRALRYQIDAADLFTLQNSTSPSAQLREHEAVLLAPGGKERADTRHRAQVAKARRSVRTHSKKNRSA